MSHDRNAGGLEQTVQRFDRLFFCRSFHSKLSLPWRPLPKGRTAGLHPSSYPKPDLKTHGLSDTPGKTTFEKPALPNPIGRGVSRFEPTPLSAAKCGEKQKSGLHPSVQAIN
jgi:hypothetical protein